MKNMIIKAKEKDGVVKAKVLIQHKMLTYKQAKKKGVEANFITHIVARVGEKVVYEFSTSQFLAKNPVIKFKFHGKKGDVLEIAWTDISGERVVASKKIK